MKLFIIFYFLFFSNNIEHYNVNNIEELIRFRAKSMVYRTNNGNGWSEWSEEGSCDILVTHDMEKLRVSLYVEDFQYYDFIGDIKAENIDKNTINTEGYYLDKMNQTMTIESTLSSVKDSEMIIKYNDIEFKYKMKLLL